MAQDDSDADTGSEPEENGTESDVTDPADALANPAENVTDPAGNVTDPAENVPTVEAPDVNVDGPDLPSPEEVPEGLRAEFWEIVLAFNVALLALALGAMMAVFNGRWTVGGVVMGVGVLALAYGFWQYRTREHGP